ncbi:MAG: YitT family protein [Bacteroidales bacterium]|uniref:YitT family protein n=1 Tax=Porphyromonas sp. TaxID=1924944 RepID=UPI002970376B|nr:YitT family protein [Porphyromonas sp.]MDD7438566.1 YitT family protein [Bacteroidales bacterium]MDY3066871.1 YitT family protein [Porphyromonas sp.]
MLSKSYAVVKDYLIITLGLFIYLISYFGFIYSHEITSGGLAGISSVISWGLNIPFSVPYNLINFSLLAVALKVIGWRFSVKTVYSVVVLGVSTSSIEKYILPSLKEFLPLQNDPALAMILGSILIGVSLGMVFSVNGSTGGTDIVATIINKYKAISIGRALIYIDVVTIAASWFIFKSPDKLVYSMLQVLIANTTIDYFLNGSRQSMQFFIVTNKHQEIANSIIKEVNRGVTFLNGEGAYTHNEMKVLMVIARKTDSVNIFRIVKEIDPKAFITQSLVRGVYGEGFDTIKVNNSKKIKPQAPDGVMIENN